jgi:hypothetical protein
MKKMKHIKILILSLLLVVTATSCKDFFDVNEPSNVVGETELELNLLMPSAQYYTAMMQYNEAFSIGQVQQHIASYFDHGIDQHYESSVSSVWTLYYTKALYVLNKMEQLADQENAVHYKGAIHTMKALTLGMATDLYGDIPYFEASQGSNFLQPGVDTQDMLYDEIQTLLSTAISEFDAQDNSGLSNLLGDGIYNGDLGKWKRLAYTLKARYAMHLTKRNGSVAAANEALGYLANGFTSNNDDFQLAFNEKQKNPWHTSVVLASNTGNVSVLFSEQLIDYMNGTSYPTAAPDPRLFDYADNGGAATFEGAENGNTGLTSAGTPANAVFNENSYYFQQNSPLVLVSYAEALFLKAEAEFLANGGTTTSTGSTQAAYDAYKMGIEANMNKIGINAALRDAYLTDPVIDVGVANLKLEHIMKEKYIALLLNPEVFTDMRRYDFSTNVFKDLSLPANQNPDIAGDWFKRAIYPTSELSKNPKLVPFKREINDPMWWEQ